VGRGGGVSCLGTLRNVSEGFGRGASLSYRSSVRKTWREGCHTKDCEKYVSEISGNGAFRSYRGSIRGT
jgi:hypothetical protein